jgi:hypothetical protein
LILSVIAPILLIVVLPFCLLFGLVSIGLMFRESREHEVARIAHQAPIEFERVRSAMRAGIPREELYSKIVPQPNDYYAVFGVRGPRNDPGDYLTSEPEPSAGYPHPDIEIAFFVANGDNGRSLCVAFDGNDRVESWREARRDHCNREK